MWETTVMHKQVSGWKVNFGPNFPESPFLELKTGIPPPPFRKTSDLGWPKFTPEYPPPNSENFRFGMTKVYSGIPPQFGKLQTWDDQSLLRNTPLPIWKTSDLGWPKFTPEYPLPPIRKTSDLGWPKFTPEYPSPQKTSDLGWPKFTPEHPPLSENFRFGMTKVYSGIPPPFGKLQIWDDQSLLRNTPQIWKTSDLGWPKFTLEYPPPFGKLQIWDDQSLLRNTPPNSENFRFGMTKVYSGIPPCPPIRKTSDLRWPKFTPEYPPPMENFRFGMTKVYSRTPPFRKTSDLGWPKITPEYPPFRKLQIWDDQSLLQNTPPFWKTSDLGWPKFTPEYPPHSENFRLGMTKVYSGIPPSQFRKLQIWDDQSLLQNTLPPRKLQIWDDQSLLQNTPPFGKLQIWDDQSLLRNTPPLENFRSGMTKVYSRIPPPSFRKTSDLGWPKFTPEYPPNSENFRFGMTKVYSRIPSPNGKLQIWDDQSLLWNTPPNSENFRFGMTKVYSRTPPPRKLQIWDDQSLLRNTPPGKLQIWDDQSLLRNTPPIQKTSDLGWPKFTPEYPPPLENFRFGMTKVYSGIPPPNSENFRFGMTKVYSRTPPPQKTSDLGWPKFTPEYPPNLENFRFGMTKVYSGIPPPPENFRFGMTKVYSRIPPNVCAGTFCLVKRENVRFTKELVFHTEVVEEFRISKRGGCTSPKALQRGCQPIIRPNFPENCAKMKKIGQGEGQTFKFTM